MLDASSSLRVSLPETRIRVFDVVAPFARPVPTPLNRALHQAYAAASTTNASGLGRFLSVDPSLDVEKAVHEPQLWNRYSYVTNNPMRYTDPNGKERLPCASYPNCAPVPWRGAATEIGEQLTVASMIGMPMPGEGLIGRFLGRIGGLALERFGFSAAERGVISTSSKILQNGGADLVKAFESGEAKELTIAGQKIIVQPDAPISGMTLHGENAFVLGKQAFSSSTELSKTVLHEMYRLTFQQGDAASAASAAAATKAAADFAERAFDVLRIIY